MSLFPDAPGALFLEEGDGTHSPTELQAGDSIAYKPETGLSIERVVNGVSVRLMFQFPESKEHVRRWPVTEDASVDILVEDYILTNGFGVEETDALGPWIVVSRS